MNYSSNKESLRELSNEEKVETSIINKRRKQIRRRINRTLQRRSLAQMALLTSAVIMLQTNIAPGLLNAGNEMALNSLSKRIPVVHALDKLQDNNVENTIEEKDILSESLELVEDEQAYAESNKARGIEEPNFNVELMSKVDDIDNEFGNFNVDELKSNGDFEEVMNDSVNKSNERSMAKSKKEADEFMVEMVNEYDTTKARISYMGGKPAYKVTTNIPRTRFKAWMPYTAITYPDCVQYKLRKHYWIDNAGYARFNKDYVVAVGSSLAKPGNRIRVTMDSGVVFYAIVGDQKANHDTVGGAGIQCRHNGSILEFLVSGSAFRRNKQQFKEFPGAVTKIEVVG